MFDSKNTSNHYKSHESLSQKVEIVKIGNTTRKKEIFTNLLKKTVNSFVI